MRRGNFSRTPRIVNDYTLLNPKKRKIIFSRTRKKERLSSPEPGEEKVFILPNPEKRRISFPQTWRREELASPKPREDKN